MTSIQRALDAAREARKPRLIASVAVGAALLLGTSGCAMISPQATLIQYAPGDGVNVPDIGPLEVRNALILAEGEDEGEPGGLIAAIVNSTDQDQTLRMQFGEGAGAQNETLRVPAKTTVSLGNPADGTPPLLLDEVDGPPGSTVPVYFQSGNAEGVLIMVPVLDQTLDYYQGILP